MCASNRPQAGNGHPIDRHLTEDELNRYVDRDLSPAERGQAETHLSTCPDCSATLADLQLLASLLQDLPEIRPPRSFQLGPEHARQPSFWSRLGAMLMPMLPVMRAATVALALTLGGVTAYRVIDEQPATGPVSEQAANQSMTPTSSSRAVQAQPTLEPTTAQMTNEDLAREAAEPNEAPANKSSGTSGAAAPAGTGPVNTEAPTNPGTGSTEMQLPGHPGPSSAADDSSAAASSGPADNSVMIAVGAASPTVSPTATASPTAVPTGTATASPSPIPTPTPAPVRTVSGEDDSWLGWVQGALAALLVAFGAAVVGLTRFRNRLP